MDFICAELLGLNHSFELWGNIANYRDVQTISIRGRVTGEAGRESISGVWTGMSPFFEYTGYQPITINGYSIGTGRLVSANFDESTDVISKPYTATLEVLKTGNLWNFTGSYYSGFFGAGATSASGPAFGLEDTRNLKYINSFQEDSTYSSKKSGEYQYDKSWSMEVDGSYTGDALAFFESVRNKLDSDGANTQLINAIYPAYYFGVNADPITIQSITYDELNRKFSATQNFVFDSSNPWTWNYKHTLNHTKDGFISVSENGDIKSSRRSGSSNIHYANLGWQSIEPGIFNRASGFYQYYITGQPNNLYSGACTPLVDFPTQFSLSKNNLIGSISYNKSYTDNPAQQSGYSHSYQDEISLGVDGIILVSENGRYKGQNSDRVSGFNQVYNAYQNDIDDIYSRVTGFYTGSVGYLVACNDDRPINITRTEETYREYFQEVSYSYQFSDDKNIVNDENFYKITATYSDQKPVMQVGYFGIANDAEIAQRQNQSTLGLFTNKISVIGRPETTMTTYLSGAAQKIVEPEGSEVFISDINYSLFKNQNEFNLSVAYTYSDYPPVPDILV